MSRLPLLLFTLAPSLLGPSLVAQALATSVVVMTSIASGNCPVGFAAKRLPGGNLVSTGEGKQNPRSPIGFNVTFLERSQGIAAARISLHGLNGAQVMPAATPARANASESFFLDPTPVGNHLFRATVYARNLTGVQWVELNELTYRDGSAWHGSAADPCRVTPNGFLLVAAAK